MSDPYGELRLASSLSTVGNRYVSVTYLTLSSKSNHVADKLELGIIQTDLDSRSPQIEFEFDPSGQFKLHGLKPAQPPVAAVKFGDVRIEIPADCQLHEIWDGKHFALDTNLTQEVFQRFVDSSEQFPPRLSQLAKFLDEAQSCTPKDKNPSSSVFEFEALDPDGQKVKDLIEATSESEARSMIEKAGYAITKFSASKHTN